MHKILFYILAMLPKKIRKGLLIKITKFFINKYANLKIEGLENIPRDSQVIFISNHLSNADGLIMQYILGDIKKVFFVAGVKLKNELITSLVLDLVPHINITPNKPDRKALREAINTVKTGNSLFIFPEGTRSRTGELLKGRSGVILIAKQTNVPIIPIGLWGTEKLLPINSGGKMGSEWFKNADVNIKIGKPFTLADLDLGDDSEVKQIDLLMLRIAELLPKEYQGYYKHR